MRRMLFQVHLWTGLILGTLFVLLGLSGSLLVYDHEILALGEKPAPKAQTSGAAMPLDAVLASARAVAPDRRMPATIQLPQRPADATVVRFQKGGRGGPQNATDVYVDPATARVLEVRKPAFNAFFMFLHQFHGNLSLGREGRQVVGWLGLGMLALGLSGVILWWPKRETWKYAFGIRKNARGYWFHRELHGALGIWSWIVFIIVSFSGVVIVFPETTRAVVSLGTAQPGNAIDLRRGVQVEPIKGAKPIGADETIALVKARFPGMDIRSITMPARRLEAIRVILGDRNNGPASIAYVDPFRRTIAAVRNPPGVPLDNFIAWQRPLHAGNGWGAVWRALVFLSGLLPAVFFVTGAVMWAKKRNARLHPAVPVPAVVSERKAPAHEV